MAVLKGSGSHFNLSKTMYQHTNGCVREIPNGLLIDCLAKVVDKRRRGIKLDVRLVEEHEFDLVAYLFLASVAYMVVKISLYFIVSSSDVIY